MLSTDGTTQLPRLTTEPARRTLEAGEVGKADGSDGETQGPRADSTFDCNLDTKTRKAFCAPKRYRRLRKGKHKFKVRATDAAGNIDPTPAKDKFRVVERP